MRGFVSGVGCLVSLVFLVASAAMNWQFGVTLGRGEVERYIYGVASVGADVMKAVLPFFLWWSLINLRLVVSLVALVLWIACAGYGVTSAIGFAAGNRAGTSGELRGKALAFEGLKSDLARKEARRTELAGIETVAEVDKRLEGQRAAWQWRASLECMDVKGKDTASFCAEYRALEALRARALEAVRLDVELPDLRSRVEGAGAASAYAHGVPQTGLLSVALGIPDAMVERGLSLLMVAVVELTSAFGFFVSLQHGELRRGRESGTARRQDETADGAESRALGDVALFADACLTPAAQAQTALRGLYERYVRWCAATGAVPVAWETFRTSVDHLCRRVGWRIVNDRLLGWRLED